jgi:hypothetical protein
MEDQSSSESTPEWELHHEGDGRIACYLQVADLNPSAFPPAVVSFWGRLLDGTAALSPEWNVLYLSVWYDSGRILAYANREPPYGPGVRHDRTDEPLYVALHSGYVLHRLDAIGDALEDLLDDDEGVSIEEEEQAYGVLSGEVHEAVRAALGEPSVSERFLALQEGRGLRAFLFDYEGEDGAEELAPGAV